MIKLLVLSMILLLFMSCDKSVEGCPTICNDGTTSKSSGSGACSYHGGIRSRGCAVPMPGKNY